MRLRQLLLTSIALLTYLHAEGQQGVFLLYPEGEVPCYEAGSQLKVRNDAEIGLVIEDVALPEVHHYAPVSRFDGGNAILLIPGGGYMIEAWDLEGVDIANYLSSLGLHVFVLRHRLPGRLSNPECKRTAAMNDAERGLAFARQYLSDSLGLDSVRVGVMGFSAGGHLAARLSIHYASKASRPDYSVLVYPVINVNRSVPTSWFEKNYLGDAPDAALFDRFDLPARVHDSVPPSILFHAADDKSVAPSHSLDYAAALAKKNIPVDLHLYASGGHGFGSARHLDTPVNEWLETLTVWLRSNNLIP